MFLTLGFPDCNCVVLRVHGWICHLLHHLGGKYNNYASRKYKLCSPQIVDFYPNRPQKVSVLQEQESVMSYPKLTICSPAFFNKER